MIKQGQTFNLLLVIFATVVAIYFITTIKKTGKRPYIRPIPAVQALPELVGRAAEMGRPIHFAGGQGGLSSTWSSGIASIMNSLLVYGEIVRLAAPTNTRVIYTTGDTANLPVAEDIGLAAAVKAGHPEYKQDLRFISSNPRSYMSGIMGIVAREKVASQFSLLGGEETLTAVYIAAQVGAMQIGGTTFIPNASWYVTGSDYFLIGEECVALSAIFGEDPSMTGCIMGEDIVKIFYIILISLSAIAITAGNKAIINFLTM